uniref:Uncharacterized protein n=1 Tax=Lotharella globosa TaxID=91324 RepID=A0A7S3ZHI1_9EUKA
MCGVLSAIYLRLWRGLGAKGRQEHRGAFIVLGTVGMVVVHVLNLVVLPGYVMSVPRLDALLLETTVWPHLCDHLAFGFSLSHYLVRSEWRIQEDTKPHAQ